MVRDLGVRNGKLGLGFWNWRWREVMKLEAMDIIGGRREGERVCSCRRGLWIMEK